MAEKEVNLNLNLQKGSSVNQEQVRDLEGRYDRKYLCFHYFTVNFFLSGFGIHLLCGSEVSLPIRLKYMRKKRAFYADQMQGVKKKKERKIRMQQQNASNEKWKEHAVRDKLPAQMNQWRRQKEKLSDGNCLCHGLGPLRSLQPMKGRIVSRFLGARKVPPVVVSSPSICQDCRANKRNQGWLCQIPSWRRGGMEWKKG